MLESLPPIERKESFEKEIINLLELSNEQENDLKRKIENNGGAIRAFVHPYFPDENMYHGTEGVWDPNKRDQMQTMFEKFVSVEGEDKTPLVVFEESKEMDQLENKLQDKLGRNIYSVPTHHGSSTPNTGFSYPEDWRVQQAVSWSETIIKLQNLGVEKITLGGQSLAFTYNGENLINPYELDGCVGLAVKSLEEHFIVEVSKFNYPIDRNQYKKYRGFRERE